MLRPDDRFLEDGNNVKWTALYDGEFEESNPYVFSRLNGTWPGAAVTEWDVSRYAAGVRDRRLNFLPPYPNGTVLITPRQAGRKKTLRDHLHPLYREILREYLTDGRHYISQDGERTFPADSYYKAAEQDIVESAKEIPLTVTGNVAWATAQTAPTHLRLTLVDGGYINPGDKTATVTFNTVTPVAFTDVLANEVIPVENGGTAKVHVACGLFRFLDVEIAEVLR